MSKMLLWHEKKELVAALRRRGFSPLEIHRTIQRRGGDAARLAFALTEKVTPDTAVALLEGLLRAPYGAQRAATVLRGFIPDVELPTRGVGTGIHAGRFRNLLRRAAKAVPYVGQSQPAEVVATDTQAAVQAAINAFQRATLWASDWHRRNYRPGGPSTETAVFRHGPVTLTIAREVRWEGTIRWVARAEVNAPQGVIRLNADALERMGVFLAV